ncbi:MAG TPA: MaoC family dehydratase N-terminal domain-containing protein [Acidimicrobiales bacterium]|nr:MaoC family dehydratase N-terminal domain-containing protein [Acidimicrobiales bacterium]
MTSGEGPSSGDEAFVSRLRSFEGLPAGPPSRALDPVNVPMIRHFVEAMGDNNPIYLDENAAVRFGHGGQVAPPAMLQVWIMRGLGRDVTSPPGAASASRPRAQDELLGLLRQAGYSAIVATNCEQTYLRELRTGDRLTAESVLETVSDEKRTALGPGHFLTIGTRYLDGAGDEVARMKFRILLYRPRPVDLVAAPAPAQASPEARRFRPIVTKDTAFFFEGLQRGVVLIQRCEGCDSLRHPPGPCCPKCGSFDWDAVAASGRGTLHSYVVVHRPQVPGFVCPYVVGLVDLEEGTRLVAELRGVDPADVRIGADLVAEVIHLDEGLALLAFRPAPSASGVRPVALLRFQDVELGDTLPALDVPLDRTLIVASAIATRDYQDVHHDPELARRSGAEDVFMNILSTNGFVGRFVTDWAGPAAVLQSIAIRLGAPNYPGDTMHLAGRVTGLFPGEAAAGAVEVEVVGSNRLGTHVTGSVRLLLPMGAS